MKLIVSFLSLCLIFIAITDQVMAVGDDFNIGFLVGSDLIAPSVPVISEVAPVAATQIDIEWVASTDNVQVQGYRVYRDGLQIATTSLTSYSDASLLPETLYSYSVDAFDAAGNFSATSTLMSTTTLALPPVITPVSSSSTNSVSSNAVAPSVRGLLVTATETEVKIVWQTSSPSRYTISWGRTTAFELGSVSSNIFNQNHTTIINNLEPGTTYWYSLQVINSRGVSSTLKEGTFVTLATILTDLPQNVSSFTAVQNGFDVELRWRKSLIKPDYLVRVMRSHLFYPATPEDGALVYEGRAEYFYDQGSLKNYFQQYYTVFVLDDNKLFSSGSVARVNRFLTPEINSEAVNEMNGGNQINSSTTPGKELVDFGDEAILKPENISILQNSTTSTLFTPVILNIDNGYLVSVPVKSVPKNLKTIIVSVQNPSNQKEVSAYLLKLNKVGDAYIALLPPPTVGGKARLTIEVFDYELATVRRISTVVTFVDDGKMSPFFPDRVLSFLKPVSLIMLTVVTSLSLGWILLFIRRRAD